MTAKFIVIAMVLTSVLSHQSMLSKSTPFGGVLWRSSLTTALVVLQANRQMAPTTNKKDLMIQKYSS